MHGPGILEVEITNPGRPFAAQRTKDRDSLKSLKRILNNNFRYTQKERHTIEFTTIDNL